MNVTEVQLAIKVRQAHTSFGGMQDEEEREGKEKKCPLHPPPPCNTKSQCVVRREGRMRNTQRQAQGCSLFFFPPPRQLGESFSHGKICTPLLAQEKKVTGKDVSSFIYPEVPAKTENFTLDTEGGFL